jgi:hypothetical protein
MSSAALIRWSGLAMLAGGALWMVKSVGIMAEGPSWLEEGFGLAQLFFAVGLLGYHALLGGLGGWQTPTGARVAVLSVALSSVSFAYDLANAGEHDPWPTFSSIVDASGALTWLLAWLLLGLAHHRERVLTGRSSDVLLGALALVPLTFAGAAAHFELPIALIGLLWVALGLVLVRRTARTRAGVA